MCSATCSTCLLSAFGWRENSRQVGILLDCWVSPLQLAGSQLICEHGVLQHSSKLATALTRSALRLQRSAAVCTPHTNLQSRPRTRTLHLELTTM